MTVHSLKEGVVIRGTTRAYRRISPCVPRFSVEVFKFLTSVIIKNLFRLWITYFRGQLAGLNTGVEK